MSIPITGLTSGKTRFLVQAGTGASLSYDFQVAPSGGGSPYTGGDYTAAFVDLTVTNNAAPCVISLKETQLSGGRSTSQNGLTLLGSRA